MLEFKAMSDIIYIVLVNISDQRYDQKLLLEFPAK